MSSLVKKYFSFALGPLTAAIFSFITTPIITWIIMPDEFGKASMFMLANSLFSFLCLLGMDSTYIRYSIEGDESYQRELISSFFRLHFVVFGIIGLSLLLFWREASLLLFKEQRLQYIAILVLTIALTICYRYGYLVLRMKQKAFACSIISIVQASSQSIATILLALLWQRKFISISLGYSLSFAVSLTIAIIIEKNFWFIIIRKNRIGLKNKLKEHIKYGFPFLLSQLIIIIFESMDKIALRKWSDFIALGLYASAFKLVGIMNIVQKSFQTFWVPVAFDKYKENKQDTKFFKDIFEIVAFIMLIISGFVLISKDLIIKILGKEYHNAAMILPFLLLIPLMSTLSQITVMGINFEKKTTIHIYIALIVSALNLIGNSLLVPRYAATGAAVSTGISYIALYALRTKWSNKLYKVNYNLKRFYLNLFIFIVLCFYNSYKEYSIYQIITGIVYIGVTIYLYKSVASKIIQYIKKVIQKRTVAYQKKG